MNISTTIAKIADNSLLEGRIAFITGGSSGIGYSIAEAFLNSGVKQLYITGRNKERLDSAIIRLKSLKSNALIEGIVLDNGNTQQIAYVLSDILAASNIDILVNNAGINGGNLFKCSEEDYRNVMDANLMGAIFISRLISEDMIKKGIEGNILNICSSSSLRPAISAYALSKWGMRAFTLGLSKSLIKHGIVVNGVAPGPTATPMLLESEQNNYYLPNNPSKRYAMPEEIANMAVMLVSKMGRLIVGDVIYMTGGAGVITYDDINY